MKFVVCGVEHSGTTLVSDLFRQVEGVDSGFEVGVLLRHTPDSFFELQPFSDNMLVGWGIDKEEFRHCCDQPTYMSFYQELQKVSREIESDTKYIFDKTPRYLSELSICLSRVDVPFIATFKDPRATVYSDYKRSKSDDFYGWYESYYPAKIQYLVRCYDEYQKNKNNSRVLFVSLEEIALNARDTMQRLFSHVGLEFDLHYIVMNDLRYKNTRSTSVSIPIAFSYKNELDAEKRLRIEEDFQELADWLYE